MRTEPRWTKADDEGYRWLLLTHQVSIDDRTPVYALRSQKKATTDSGKAYFKYSATPLQFATPQARDAFMGQFKPKEFWKER